MLSAALHTARLRRRRGRHRHAARAAGGGARHPPHRRRPALPGAQHVPRAGDARRRHRARADVLHRAVRRQLRLPDRAAPRALLRDHVLPAGAGRGQGRHRPRTGQPRRGRPVARPGQAGRVQPGHAAARGTWPDGRVLPGVPGSRDRAHRDADPRADRRADAGHAVLAVPDEPLLRAGGAVRAGDDRALPRVPSIVLGRFFNRSAQARG